MGAMSKPSVILKNLSEPSKIPAFEPVPRKLRQHKGWTPARQRAFIEALAETASVGRTAKMVNMSTVSCYGLRKHPQGADFRRAWDAAIDLGVQHLKDIAFERAVEGQLEPVWQRGKLVGHKRKYSDALLMFLLKNYGTDENGRNVTVNYVHARAGVAVPRDARPGGAEAGAEAQATTMTVRASKPSVKSCAKQEQAADILSQFKGVKLDRAARAEISNALIACAARQREIEGSYDDPEISAFTAGKMTPLWLGTFEPPHGWVEDVGTFDPDEPSWRDIGAEPYVPPVYDAEEGEQTQDSGAGVAGD